jgi:aspartyl-tRNA(Asn)/glutamyl-tRNA(Gln) amidotransferase subunit A
VRDGALALNVMSGYDAGDSTSYPSAAPDFLKNLTENIKGLRIGIPKEYRLDGMEQEIVKAWEDGVEILRSAGASITEISLPHTEYALPAYYIIAPAEASSNLARYDGVKYGLRVEGADIHEMYENTRGEGFGDEVKRRIFIGTFVLSSGYYDAYYTKAQKVKTLINQDFKQAFEKVDAILTPSTPGASFGFDEKDNDPIKMYLNDVFTVTANLAGLPAASVPVRLNADGLPLGLQVIGKPFDEQTTLNVCAALESGFAFRPDPFV